MLPLDALVELDEHDLRTLVCMRPHAGGHLARIERNFTAFVDEHEVPLTALELRLLVTLYDRRDRVQSRTALLSDVWGIEADVTTRTVDTHVKRLREKLGAAGEYIETVRGVGYRFAGTPGMAGA